MTNQPRTDVHRPTELITEDYSYVGAYDSQAPGDRPVRLRLMGLIAASTTTAHRNGHQCDHCGAHLRYVAVLLHHPTGDHLAIGETCLDNRFSQATADFHRMRTEAKLDRERHAILNAWGEYQAANTPTGSTWTDLHASTNPFVMDVLAKGRRYGHLTERQFDAITKAVTRDTERAARATAPRAIEATGQVPTGNAVITGTVLSLKQAEGYMPGTTTTKMLVKVTEGGASYRIFGTVPGSLYNVEVGQRVTFTAKLTPSDDDQGFGFFSRPRKATIVEEVVAA